MDNNSNPVVDNNISNTNDINNNVVNTTNTVGDTNTVSFNPTSIAPVAPMEPASSVSAPIETPSPVLSPTPVVPVEGLTPVQESTPVIQAAPVVDTNNVVTPVAETPATPVVEQVQTPSVAPVAETSATPVVEQVQTPSVAPVVDSNVASTPVVDTNATVNVAAASLNDNVNTNTSDIVNNVTPDLGSTAATLNEDEELLKAYIGSKYDKITTEKFNIFAFAFTSFYMYYRKMFLYGLIVGLVELIIVNFVPYKFLVFAINILIGIFTDKLYVSFAKKEVNKIKIKNAGKSLDELKNICSSKGGTSKGLIFAGFGIEVLFATIMVVVMMLCGLTSFIGDLLKLDNVSVSVSSNSDEKKVQVVSVNSYNCSYNDCTFTISDSDGNSYDYFSSLDCNEIFKNFSDYASTISLDIYYSESDDLRTINNFKIYLISSGSEISGITTEDDLRKKLGMYTNGTYTDTLTLISIGFTFEDFDSEGNSIPFTRCIFIDANNNSYEMDYYGDSSALVENNSYTVTFTAEKQEFFGYDYIITSLN